MSTWRWSSGWLTRHGASGVLDQTVTSRFTSGIRCQLEGHYMVVFFVTMATLATLAARAGRHM